MMNSLTTTRLAQIANNATGKCAYCSTRLAAGSKSMCEHHLKSRRERERQRRREKKLIKTKGAE